MVATHSCVLSIGSALCLGRSRASDSHLEPTNGRTLLCVGRDDGVATHQSGIEPGIPKPYPDGGAFRQRSVGIVSYSSMRLCCVWLFVLLTGLLLLFPSWLVGSNKKQKKTIQNNTIQQQPCHLTGNILVQCQDCLSVEHSFGFGIDSHPSRSHLGGARHVDGQIHDRELGDGFSIAVGGYHSLGASSRCSSTTTILLLNNTHPMNERTNEYILLYLIIYKERISSQFSDPKCGRILSNAFELLVCLTTQPLITS